MSVKMTKEGEERIDRLTAEGKCPDCGREFEPNERKVCGVCESCYSAQYYAIRKGTESVANLIAAGKRLPNGIPGRKPKTEEQARRLGRSQKGS